MWRTRGIRSLILEAAIPVEHRAHPLITGAGYYSLCCDHRWHETAYSQVRNFIRRLEQAAT